MTLTDETLQAFGLGGRHADVLRKLVTARAVSLEQLSDACTLVCNDDHDDEQPSATTNLVHERQSDGGIVHSVGGMIVGITTPTTTDTEGGNL